MRRVNFTERATDTDNCATMESETIRKNKARVKSRMGKGELFIVEKVLSFENR